MNEENPAAALRAEDVEAIARATHLVYAETRGTTPIAWADMDAEEREANLDSARFAPLLLAALGLQIDSAVDGPRRDALTAEELDAGSRLEHLRWCRFTRRVGRHDHPDLVPWDQLSEPTRELDRLRVRALPRVLAELGYSVRERVGPA